MVRWQITSLRGRDHAVLLLVAALLALPLRAVPARAAEVTVLITDTLEPARLTVAPGTTVRWENRDGARHRVRSDDGPVRFDSGNLDPGATYAFLFEVEGTYDYRDDRNEDDPAYVGSITVSAGAPAGGQPGTGGGTQPDPGGGAGGGGSTAPVSGDVTIVDDSFRPRTIEVAVGGSVTWANRDREHTVTARDRSFDSGVFDAGGTFTRTFPTAGSVDYFCLIHPDMTGTVRVLGGTGSPAQPSTGEPPPGATPEGAPADRAPPAAPPGATAISIEDFAFAPMTVTVPTGTEVVWTNSGQAPHTVTEDGGSFDSGFLSGGEGFRRVFRSAGTYAYLCTLHPEMTGTVRVTGATVEGADPPGDGGPSPTAAEQDGTEGADGGAGASVSSEAAGTFVSIIDLDFVPGSVELAVGEEITWRNDGELPHTVTADDGSFDSGIMQAGDTFVTSFSEVGELTYLCAVHPDMVGTVVVTAAADSSITSAAGELPVDDGGDSSGLLLGVLLTSVVLAGITVLTVWRVRTNAARDYFGA